MSSRAIELFSHSFSFSTATAGLVPRTPHQPPHSYNSGDSWCIHLRAPIEFITVVSSGRI